MSEDEETPEPLRGFGVSQARKLYFQTATTGGAFVVLLFLMSYFSNSIQDPILVDIGLGALALLMLCLAYFLPRAFRVYARSLKFRR